MENEAQWLTPNQALLKWQSGICTWVLSDETLDPTGETIHLSYEGDGNRHSGHLVKIQAGGAHAIQGRRAQPRSVPAVPPCGDLRRPAGSASCESVTDLAAASHLPLCC